MVPKLKSHNYKITKVPKFISQKQQMETLPIMTMIAMRTQTTIHQDPS